MEFEFPEPLRRSIFAATVELEDSGVLPEEVRREVGARFGIHPALVEAIVEEGILKTWPPLTDCCD